MYVSYKVSCQLREKLRSLTISVKQSTRKIPHISVTFISLPFLFFEMSFAGLKVLMAVVAP